MSKDKLETQLGSKALADHARSMKLKEKNRVTKASTGVSGSKIQENLAAQMKRKAGKRRA